MTEAVEVVDDPPAAQTARKGRRHLIGALFGR
jgi:hypothetical protein